jgi:peptide/nickel transport system permease protein
VLTETIFNWPGLGLFLTEAVLNRDFNVIQASAFLIVLSFVSVNLSVDLAYLWLNPRLREESS